MYYFPDSPENRKILEQHFMPDPIPCEKTRDRYTGHGHEAYLYKQDSFFRLRPYQTGDTVGTYDLINQLGIDGAESKEQHFQHLQKYKQPYRPVIFHPADLLAILAMLLLFTAIAYTL